MKKMYALFSVLFALMFAFAVPVMATEAPPVTITGQVEQNSSAVVTTSGFGSFNGANASFGQDSNANYTATGKDVNGSAIVNGLGQITATFDNDGRKITSSASGSISNDASASADNGKDGKNNPVHIDADIAGKGAIATNTVASMGLGNGSLVGNGAFGQTSSYASFNYALDPTVSVSGNGAATGFGSSVVTNLTGGDSNGYKVMTSSVSTAGASVPAEVKPLR